MDGSGPGLKVPDLWARLGWFLVPAASFMCFGSFGPFREVSPFLLLTPSQGGPTFPFPVWMLAELRVLTLPFEFGGGGGFEGVVHGKRKRRERNVKKRMREQNNKEHSSKNR